MPAESTALSRNVGGRIDAFLSLQPLMDADRLARLEASAATRTTETPLAQLISMFQRLLF